MYDDVSVLNLRFQGRWETYQKGQKLSGLPPLHWPLTIQCRSNLKVGLVCVLSDSVKKS